MSFKRDIREQFMTLLGQYPVLTVTGPRQSGKTTLVKTLCRDYAYVNLEEPDIRAIAMRDPRTLLNKYPERLIIDEIQHVPELLSYIQARVDHEEREGMYVLTGSHQLALHEAVAQSLAGRTALLELLPLSLHELESSGIKPSLNEHLLTGFYPRIHDKKLDPTQAYRDYIKTYLERDVRQMIHLKDLMTFQRFMKLCAARVGQMLNMNNLANEVGVSHHTIKSWLSILQASFLIVLMAPYFENFGKQMVKSPKLYFTDVGLASYLLEIETLSQIDRDPLRGHLFENLVVMEFIKTRLNQGRDPHLYYYRDSQKNEVDVIYKRGAELIPIEIKSAQTLHGSYFKGLDYFRRLVGTRCGEAYVVYSGEETFSLREGRVLNYQSASDIVLDADKKDEL